MKNFEKPKVDLNRIIDALDMSPDHFRRFVNTITGEVVILLDEDDFPDIEEEEVEDDLIPDHYISLPDRMELNIYGIMEDFVVQSTMRKCKIIS